LPVKETRQPHHRVEAKEREGVSTPQTPEEYASTREAASLVESAILALPLKYRAVLMMRDIEEMGVEETASSLGISTVNVKVRLHHARALMRMELYSRVRATNSAAFKFLGVRCDRIVRAVLERRTQLEEGSALTALCLQGIRSSRQLRNATALPSRLTAREARP
jgi:RNA polymerase sigma-70 factor, ECF subfamily